MSEISEAVLRDLLAERLDLVGDGLTLLDTEQYIPSSIGTRSFIDILAKDSRGRWVLIELKRSDAAARQAIHEIYKYVEGVKAHLGARDDEIRAVIISTEWKELLVPFSRFAADTSISVGGMKLLVDDAAGALTGSEKIEPLRISSGRLLSPSHEINYYESEARLEEGICSYDASCAAKGLADYILIEMQAPEGLYQRSIEALAATLYAMQGGEGAPPPEFVADTSRREKRLDLMLYFVPQQLSAEQYLDVIRRDPEVYEEVCEWANDMEGDELLDSLQSYAQSAEPEVDRDRYDVGYPAKFIGLLDTQGWQVRKIHRRGSFARNTVLTDATLLGEVAGETGVTGQRLKRSIHLADKGEVSQLAKDIDACLEHNPVWRAALRDQLAEAQSDFPGAELDISVFAPTTGLMTLYYAMQEEGPRFLPSYFLTVRDGEDIVRLYVGELAAAGDEPVGPEAFLKVVADYYGGDFGGMLMMVTWGSYESRDIDILDDLGLAYDFFRCDIDGDARTFFRQRNGRWRRTDAVKLFDAFSEYFARNQRLFHLLDKKISPRNGGVMWDGSSAVARLAPLVDEAIAARGEYHISPPAECDVCTVPLAGEPFISDAALLRDGSWATLCADCTVYHGAGIGWGTGQLYRREADGGWLTVAGLDPDPEADDEP